MFCLVSVFPVCLLRLATNFPEFLTHQIFKTIPAAYLQKTTKKQELGKRSAEETSYF